MMLSLTQHELGARLGVSFQQVQKYENACNRVAASTLYAIARILDVRVGFFFDNTDPVRARAIPGGFAVPLEAHSELEVLHWPETIQLVDAYFAIQNPRYRRGLLELAHILSNLDAKAKRATRRPPRQQKQRSSSLELRDIRVSGRHTTVRLEAEMWEALKEIAAQNRVTVNQLVTKIDQSRNTGNLTSAIRVHVAEFYRRHPKISRTQHGHPSEP